MHHTHAPHAAHAAAALAHGAEIPDDEREGVLVWAQARTVRIASPHL